LKIRSCRFVCSAYRPEEEPRDAGPEIVLLGRSNVGKSSLINRLVGKRNLARTSSAPGRTQSVNFYRVNETWSFVDLPGYGYARVPEAVRRSWKPMVEGALARHRERIALALLVVDARIRPTDLDRTMRDWLRAEDVPYLALATKADRLSGNERTAARRRMGEGLGPEDGERALLVSAETGLGIATVWGHLDRALEGAQTRS
jgi:GTP-binding protein